MRPDASADPASGSRPAAGVRLSFFAELRRRHVYKMGAMYCVAGWLLVQVVTQVLPVFDVSALGQRVLVLIVVAGFPVALVLAWLFDLTAEGIVRTAALPAGGETQQALQGRRGIERKLNYLLGGLLLCALGYFVAERMAWVGGRGAASAPADAKAIAVLPFDNLSDDKSNAYFAAGMQDEILTRLAGVGDLTVISRLSTEKLRSHPDDLRTVAAELGVGSVIEGSVQKAGAAVRVSVQLIDAHSDKSLWAQSYDRDAKDAFAVESEVAQDIAETLKARLTEGETQALALLPTRNAAAYDLFLQGMYENSRARNWQPDAGEHFIRAEQLYRQALAQDPDFALARAQLALCLLAQRWNTHDLDPALLAAAQTEAGQALAQAPRLSEAHLAMGYYHYYGHLDYVPAHQQFEQALALEPGSEPALRGMARVERRQGRWSESLESFERVLKLAPNNGETLGDYGETLLSVRRYAEAEAALRRSQALEPDDANTLNNLFFTRLVGAGDVEGARSVIARWPRNQILNSNGSSGDLLNVINAPIYLDVIDRRYDDARRAWDQVAAGTPEARLQGSAARAALAVLSGQARDSQAECGQLKAGLEAWMTAHAEEPNGPSWLAWAELCLGHPAAAVQAAQRAYDLGPLEKDAYSATFLLAGEAQVAALAGQRELALQLIQRLFALSAGQVMSVARLKLDPVWDGLRQDPRFIQLLVPPPIAPS